MLLKLIKRFPFLSKCIICSVGGSTSDLIAQKIVEKRERLNLDRTRTFAVLGFFVVGPALTIWYRYLDKRFINEPNKYKAVFYKVGLDQLVFTPIIQIVYIAALSFLQGLNIEQTSNRIYTKLGPILLINYKLWPLSQLVNFLLIPLPYQVIFVQAVAILWNAIVSTQLNRELVYDEHKQKNKKDKR